MMNVNFDKIIDRRNTGSLKVDKYKDRDIISMWVADMDFAAPTPVIDAIRDRLEHGILGYSVPTDELNDIVVKRMANLYGWDIDPDWIVWLPSLVVGINVVTHLLARDDEMITFVPAYPPFLISPHIADTKLHTVELAVKDGRYTFDIEAFKNAITDRTRIFILCNPYNPVGRVFDEKELEAITKICLERDILICSDEIHCELILSDKTHIPTATLSQRHLENTITLMSPAKTFNLPGMNTGLAIIADPELRKQYTRKLFICAPPCINALGLVACKAAYSQCEQYKGELVEYLKENAKITYDFVNTQIPHLKMKLPEATYLAWIDVRDLAVDDAEKFFEDAGVGLQGSKGFGVPGFVRLNFGCPRKVLLEALQRMKRAVDSL
jgi:cystathionine beta-lyase